MNEGTSKALQLTQRRITHTHSHACEYTMKNAKMNLIDAKLASFFFNWLLDEGNQL